MSKGLVMRATLLVALTLPAAALGGFPGARFNDYEGNAERDPLAQVGFDVDRVNGDRVARNFDLFGIPFACRDGSVRREEVLFDDDFIPVERGKGTLKTDEMLPHVLKVEGALRRGGTAQGTLRLATHSPGTPAAQCYSGLLSWKAERTT